MVLPALVSLKGLIKTKSYHIDLPFFRLHYQVTVCLLLGFCLTITAKVLFGETIKCLSPQFKEDHKWMDNLCYSTGTYTSYELMPGGGMRDSRNVTFQVNPSVRYIFSGMGVNKSKNAPRITFWHNYYQYAPVILFIQAIFFYLPHYLWKLWENGLVSSVCKRLHEARFAPNDYFDNNYDIVYYIRNVLKFNKSLVYKYYFCHALCLLNLVLQIIAMDTLFNYQFLTYGYTVLQYMLGESLYGMQSFDAIFAERHEYSNLNNPMNLVFPKVTSCHFTLASPAGLGGNSYTAICVLPLNILHDKFFLILWCWLAVLLVLTVIQVIRDLLFTALPFFRTYFFNRQFGGVYLTEPDGWFNKPSSSLQELFLLSLIGHNSDKFSFSALLRKLKKDDWTACPSESRSTGCSQRQTDI